MARPFGCNNEVTVLTGDRINGRNNEVAEGGVPPYIGPLILKAIVM